MIHRTPWQRRRGFSLIELIVVTGMILLLVAMLLPAVLQAQLKQEKDETKNLLRQVGIAVHNMDGIYKKLPPAYGTLGLLMEGALHVHLLPFDEQNVLYNQILNEGLKKHEDAKVPQYLSPDDPSNKGGKATGIQNFATNLRIFSDKARETPYDKDFDDLKGQHPCSIGLGKGFPDGTSNTILFATKYAVCGEGGSRFAAAPDSKFAAFFGQKAAKKPAHASDETASYQLNPDAKECRCSPLMAQSLNKEGLLVCMGDVVVRTVSPKVSARTWNMLVQPNDNQKIDDPEWVVEKTKEKKKPK